MRKGISQDLPEGLENQHHKGKARSIPCRVVMGWLFCFSFIPAILITGINPVYAFADKDAIRAMLSSKSIPAKAAIVVDPKGSVIFSKNQDVRLPPASTTKLVTAMVALDKLDPECIVKINPSAAKVPSEKPRLRANEKLTVSNLLHLALMKSVNSAAVAIAEGTVGSEEGFVELMNQKTLSIGAVNTRFANASGLPDGLQYTTAYDLTLILNEALKYPLIKEILGKKKCIIETSGGRSLSISSTDRLLWATDNIIGGKTGYTRNAQYCFVGAFQTSDGLVFTAVLGTKSKNRLWKSTKLLYNLGCNSQSMPATRLSNGNDEAVSSVSVK